MLGEIYSAIATTADNRLVGASAAGAGDASGFMAGLLGALAGDASGLGTAVGLRASDDAFGLFVGGSAGLAAQLRGSHGVGDGCDGAVTKR